MANPFKDINFSSVLRDVSCGMTDLPLIHRLKNKDWNQWRRINPEISIDLSGAKPA